MASLLPHFAHPRRLAVALPLALAAATAPGAAQEHDHPAGDAGAVGMVTFPTSCAPAVAHDFERAVAMLHSFWFQAADSAFGEIARADPACALARWGTAMTLMGNPMARVLPPAG